MNDLQVPKLVEAMRKYQYTNRRARETLSRLNSETGAIVEWSILKEFEDFSFNVDRDNKSVYKPSSLFIALEKYGMKRDWNPDDDCLKKAIDLCFKTFGYDGSTPKLALSLDKHDIIESIHAQKSSGAPYFTSKGDAFSKDLPRCFSFLNGERAPDPCVAYHRVQHGDKGPKVRLVWGYPLSITIGEGLFARPLIEKFKMKRTPMAFGMPRFKLSARLIPISNSGVRYGVDFSKFDSSVCPKLITTAFNVLRTHFNLDSCEDLWFDRIIWYFIHTPILMPDGFVYRKDRGIPSGSYFTQLIGSLVNYILIQYCALRINGAIHNDKLMVLGDDSIFGVDWYVNLKAITRVANELGFETNPDKIEVFRFGENFKFLGKNWCHGLQDRAPIDTLKRMVFPERVSGIKDPRQRIAERVLAFSSDSLSSHLLVSRWCKYKGPEVPGIYLRFPQITLATDWQRHLSQEGCMPTNHDSFFLAYAGVLL